MTQRKNETREEYLARQREARANMTPEQRENYRARHREYKRKRRANMTPEQLEKLNACQREQRASMTPEQREEHRARRRKSRRESIANMTPEQHEKAVAAKAEYDRNRRASETPEQREARLARTREHSRKRNALVNVNPHSPWDAERRVPKELNLYIRVTCLRLGGDPGVPSDVARALNQVSLDFPWMQRGHLHPDHLVVLSGALAGAWRNQMSPKGRKKVLDCYESGR